jgi:peptidoglycan/LPS O-acetylase OafA/YrhL
VPVYVVIARYGQGIPVGARVILGITITVVCALISWFLVEQPFLRWKDRLEQKSAASRGDMAPELATTS